MINKALGARTPVGKLLTVLVWHLFASSGVFQTAEAGDQAVYDSLSRLPNGEIEAKLLGFELAKIVYEQNKIDEQAQSNGSSRIGFDLGQNKQKSKVFLENLFNGAKMNLQSIGQTLRGNLESKANLISQISSNSLSQVNCLGLLRADSDAKLVPKFYLFTDEQPEVPVEFEWFGSQAGKLKCNANDSKVHPGRITVFLTHGFIAGYRLMDSFINIKDRLLDMNRITGEAARNGTAAKATGEPNDTESHKFNVFVVDWYAGANPNIRANYIKSVANSIAIGRLMANFIHKLELDCNLQPENVLMISHSLGSHVAGFAGKYYKSQYGKTIGKMLHLDPPGLCFGDLFGKPNTRLSKGDAKLVNTVHTGRDIFRNPLDGSLANFMVNGGLHQPGCSSDSTNSTLDAIYLALGVQGILAPCSHLRAVSLFEDDFYEPGQCQIVAYECSSYVQFLDGKCASCKNGGCKLLSFRPYLGKLAANATSRDQVTTTTSTQRPDTTIRTDVKGAPSDETANFNGAANAKAAASRFGLLSPSSTSKEPEARTYHVGTSSTSPYCINYYQFRFVFDEAKVESVGSEWPADNKLIFAVKLTDDKGKFFKGFSLRHKLARGSRDRNCQLARATTKPKAEQVEDNNSPTIIPGPQVDQRFKIGLRRLNPESQTRNYELTVLLNSTIPNPNRITTAVISFYNPLMVNPQTVELNYMSNISPR